MAEVPDLVILFMASGVPRLGRTRTFCQVSLQKFPKPLALLIVNVSCVVVIELRAMEVPLATALMFLLSLAEPPIRSISDRGGSAARVENKARGSIQIDRPDSDLTGDVFRISWAGQAGEGSSRGIR
jgi:hypothetical protein